MEFPDELWKIVKDYQIDHKKHHKRNMEPCLDYINGLYSEVYLYSSVFPTLGYGSEVVGGENDGLWVPLQNLPVTIVGWNLNGRQKWWYGFGWIQKKDKIDLNKNRFKQKRF